MKYSNTNVADITPAQLPAGAYMRFEIIIATTSTEQ